MPSRSPRVILLDIETSPIMGYTWGTYDQNVLKVLENSKIISVAWKELHDEEVQVKALADYRGYKGGELDDEKLVRQVWDVLDTADIVIAHHGDAFDLKKLNARFIFYGLNAPSHYDTIDTLKVAKKFFAFDGNSLNALGEYLNEGKKIENGGFGLWVRCMAGDKKAWQTMKDYNAQDVILLEKVYLRLRPFMSNHPNLNLVVGDPSKDGQVCGSCLSTNTIRRGFSVLKTGRKQRYQCQDCGSWSVGAFEKTVKSLLPVEE